MQQSLSDRRVTAATLLATAFVLISASMSCWAFENQSGLEWSLKKDKKGIQVYTSAFPGSKFKAVKAITTIDAPLNSVIALVLDSAACSEWADLCKTSEVFEQVSANESYIYTYNDIPFPVKDRDVLAHVIWERDTPTGRVTMQSNAVTGKKDLSEKAIRLEDATARWSFTAQENGSVLVESYAHVDPNGPTPAWLANLLLVGSPYKTLFKMREIVETGRYAHTVIPF